ncbi:MAG: DUF4097 domain-containing protein [Gammaproteobacteria bacterium]|nr:DUF4097 domain-containing protein [Gammaproteobacteria bacterium]
MANQNFSAQEPIAIDINVVNHNELLLNGKHGNVSVSGLPGATSITVTGMKRVLSESVQDAQAHLQDLTVTAQDLTTSALLKTNQPQCELGRGYIVDYTIMLPDFFLVRVNNNGGDVAIDSIDNEVSINNIAGTVTLMDIVGSAAVNMVSGNIVAEITSLPLYGTIQMKILTGDINLEIPTTTSANFTARVFTGNITLTNLVLLSPVVTPSLVTGILGTGQGNIDLETEVIGDIDVLGI